MPTEDNYVVMVLVVGDTGVGKTHMVEAFTQQEEAIAALDYRPTKGVEFTQRKVDVKNKKIKLQLWDTAGDKLSHQKIESHYHNTSIIVLVFDVTRQDTFDNLSNWLNDLRTRASDAQIILVGTGLHRIDTKELGTDSIIKRKISTEQARSYAAKEGLAAYIEVDARNPKELGTRLLTAMTPKLQEITATSSSTSTIRREPNIQIAPPQTRSSHGFFSRSNTPTAQTYLLLTRRKPNEDRHFSDDFRAIFKRLYIEKGLFTNRTVVAKAVLDNTATLNQVALEEHAREGIASNSDRLNDTRTAKTIAVLKKLRQITSNYKRVNPGEVDVEIIRKFLRDFRKNYITDYNESRFGIFRKTAAIVDWVHKNESNESLELLRWDALRTRVIEVLSHAEAKPSSRTAMIVKELLAKNTSTTATLSKADSDSSEDLLKPQVPLRKSDSDSDSTSDLWNSSSESDTDPSSVISYSNRWWQ